MNRLFSNNKNEKGQGLVEYAIILALVAIVVIGVMRVMGPKISCTFEKVNNSLPGGSNSSNCGGGSPKDFGNNYYSVHSDAQVAITSYCSSLPAGTGYNLFTIEEPDWYGSGTTQKFVSAGYNYPNFTPVFKSTGTCP